ncbi:maleylpyruvate isomerase N-terminal domain-containing protein [Pseudonocardia thermophila]|uniref:maleylpyruvate isomerase N-terminal domain-containing protein n=1 Tax=Pseudonocardia thermophila TaxID=1848 RepID=UPI00248F430E|nr:maleylpyruvate isomerase N-terminal domain-containing protein [Pseudonocardia thermophila]
MPSSSRSPHPGPDPRRGAATGREAAWTAVDAHRRDLVQLLATLSAADWTRPSLCSGWTVRDVAAHVALQTPAGAGCPTRWWTRLGAAG